MARIPRPCPGVYDYERQSSRQRQTRREAGTQSHGSSDGPRKPSDALRDLAATDIRIAIAGLPQDQKDVLFLRVLADLSIAEVAAATDKTAGAVKSLQARAIAALRRTMGEKNSQTRAVS